MQGSGDRCAVKRNSCGGLAAMVVGHDARHTLDLAAGNRASCPHQEKRTAKARPMPRLKSPPIGPFRSPCSNKEFLTGARGECPLESFPSWPWTTINSISLSQVNPVAEGKARKTLPFHTPPFPSKIQNSSSICVHSLLNCLRPCQSGLRRFPASLPLLPHSKINNPQSEIPL